MSECVHEHMCVSNQNVCRVRNSSLPLNWTNKCKMHSEYIEISSPLKRDQLTINCERELSTHTHWVTYNNRQSHDPGHDSNASQCTARIFIEYPELLLWNVIVRWNVWHSILTHLTIGSCIYELAIEFACLLLVDWYLLLCWWNLSSEMCKTRWLLFSACLTRRSVYGVPNRIRSGNGEFEALVV